MAWNVVIAGGGFGGAAAARELERVMPKQSARLLMVNEQNFALYTPFLPEAAAGTLEPRHVTTPLRDILRRTYLRLGSIVGHDPEANTVRLAPKHGPEETLPYDQLLLSLGSVSRVLPVPGLSEHAVGFKSLADAIYLRNHVIETLEEANATEDPARRDELLTYVFVGGGYAGLEALAELQDLAADAMDRYPRARLHGMRWVLVEAADRVLPEIDLELAEYALRELRGRGIDIRLRTTLEEVGADFARLSGGETIPTQTVVWTAGVAPQPILRQLNVPLDERGRVPVDSHLRVRDGRGLGNRRLRRGPRPARRYLPADRAARGPPGPRRGAQHRRRARDRLSAGVQLPLRGLVRQPRPLQGGRPDRGPYVPRLSGLVVGPDLPHVPDSGNRTQGPRRARLDREPAVQARYLRGRLDRPSEAVGVAAGAAPQRRARRGRTDSCRPTARSSLCRDVRPSPTRKNGGVEYLVIALSFGLATAIIGRAKGSSFFIWLVIGTVLPPLGLIAVILYRVEREEPERQCPSCHKSLKLYVQVCPRCGTDLYLPDPAAVRHPGVR